MYINVEFTRLDYFKKQQIHIRAELYQGIVDSVTVGEVQGEMVRKQIVLAASFIGVPRDMRRHYLDAILLVSRFRKPNFFIKMTCNPKWFEIQ